MIELLEKYAEHGISQLDDLRVLQVPPFNELGSAVEIASRFGGSDLRCVNLNGTCSLMVD